MNTHASYTEALAASLPANGRAKGGYVCFAGNGAPSNAARSHAGYGDSPQAAARAALYWSNQAPWVKVTPWSKAPTWARDEAAGRAKEKAVKVVNRIENLATMLTAFAALADNEAAVSPRPDLCHGKAAAYRVAAAELNKLAKLVKADSQGEQSPCPEKPATSES